MCVGVYTECSVFEAKLHCTRCRPLLLVQPTQPTVARLAAAFTLLDSSTA